MDDIHQPAVILHELTHCYHNFGLGEDYAPLIKCFERAMKSGKYNSVAHANGSDGHKHYACNNVCEFFAEMTEAYFWKNDYFPFNREDLE